MSTNDKKENSDSLSSTTSSNSSRNKLKSPHTVLKQNQANTESKQSSNSAPIQEQVDHYKRLLEETQISLDANESIISILKQQIKKIETSLETATEELQNTKYKYDVTLQELNNLKLISEKYREDIQSLLENRSNEVVEIEKITVCEEIQVEFEKDDTNKTNNLHSDENILQNHYANINRAMQDQNEKIELFLKELKDEFEKYQERIDSKTTTFTNYYAKFASINQLILDNKDLQLSLSKLQDENNYLINKEGIENVNKLQSDFIQLQNEVKELYKTNEQLKKQLQAQPNSYFQSTDNTENNLQPNNTDDDNRTYNIQNAREGSKIIFKMNTNQLESSLLKENEELRSTLNQLTAMQSIKNPEIEQFEQELAKLNLELKERDEEILNLKKQAEVECSDKLKKIEDLVEKENQIKEQLNIIVENEKQIKNELEKKENILNEKDNIITKLENEIQELQLTINKIVNGSTEMINSRTDELKKSIEALNSLLAKSMEEKQLLNDELSKHLNCNEIIDSLNKKVAANVEDINNLKSIVKSSKEELFDLSNILQQYEEEVEFRNTENEKLKQNENQLNKTVESLQLKIKELEGEIEKSTPIIMELLEKYNKFKEDYEWKIEQLSISNVGLEQSISKKIDTINNLKSLNENVNKELQDIKTRHKKDNEVIEKSLSEISVLYKLKENELKAVTDELEQKKADSQLLEEENNKLKTLLVNVTHKVASEEKQFLKSIHDEEYNESNYETSKYIDQINEIKLLSLNYDKAVQRNTELNDFLNKVSTELNDLKQNLRQLLEELSQKLNFLKENSDRVNGLDPESKNNVEDMCECVNSFEKLISVEPGQKIRNPTEEIHNVAESRSVNKNLKTDNENPPTTIQTRNLIVKRKYLLRQIENIDKQLNTTHIQSNEINTDNLDCKCEKSKNDLESLIFRRQNFLEQIENIDRELSKYNICCKCNLRKSEDVTVPSIQWGESLQIMNNMSISLSNMKEQLTTKIRNFIINRDQVIDIAKYEKDVQDKCIQSESGEDDAQNKKINVSNYDKSSSPHFCECIQEKPKALYKFEKPTKDIQSEDKQSQNLVNPQSKSTPSQNEENLEPVLILTVSIKDNTNSTSSIIDKEEPTKDVKSDDLQSENVIDQSKSTLPLNEETLEPMLPHTVIKENTSTPNSKKDKDRCNCDIIMEDN